MDRRLLILIFLLQLSAAAQTWQSIDEGLALAEFSERTESGRRADLIAVRIDPKRFSLQLLTVSEVGGQPLAAQEWAERYGLIGVINAGMFQEDRRRHVGFMKNGAHVNNPSVNGYQSVLAFNPLVDSLPPVRLFDLDELRLQQITVFYRTVIQNLRLIKYPRENRWRESAQRWTEAALGQDEEGNILFLYCSTPLSMYEFNTLLLRLPLRLVSAQHLEGGRQAALYLSHADRTLYFYGGSRVDRRGKGEVPLPNVLGFTKISEPRP